MPGFLLFIPNGLVLIVFWLSGNVSCRRRSAPTLPPPDRVAGDAGMRRAGRGTGMWSWPRWFVRLGEQRRSEWRDQWVSAVTDSLSVTWRLAYPPRWT